METDSIRLMGSGNPPETKFTRLGDDRIAYQVVGEGPVDLLYVPPTGDSLDLRWDWPPYAAFLRRLSSFSRLIMFDRRGSGASDPISNEVLPQWEEWADDVRAVLDAAGSERAALYGSADAGPTAMLFAATEPERTQALILMTTSARFMTDSDYPLGLSPDVVDQALATLEEIWGTEAFADFGAGGDIGVDEGFRRWFAKSNRAAYSPRAAIAYLRASQRIDVRAVLSSIRVPTLILHREDFPWLSVEHGRYLADHIPEAKFILVPGREAVPFAEPSDDSVREIEKFLTGASGVREADRVLAAVLFTDIVGSTERAAALGDRRWRDLLESHGTVARTVVEQHRGRFVKNTGDGLLVTFDGPGRAIRCANALREALRPLGIEIRAGLHTGEVELIGNDVGGIGVHVAARVLEHAAPGELLVSHAVPVLVTGSDIAFEDRGEHALKGVPGEWRLFAVQN